MNKNLKIKLILAVLFIAAAAYFAVIELSLPAQRSTPPSVPGIEYKNETYGFSVALPLSWRGYSVTIDKWTGNAIDDQLGEAAFTDGPVVSIHNPKWTSANTYQDIPIMVFTLDQWNELRQEKFHIGAAPIGPGELGRNAKYVFALPARYNYSFPPGYEEVDQIIQSKPLTTF